MLKNLILKSKKLLNREEDKLPLFMRGELEVIVRDEHDRVIDYQRGDNVVSDFMKHEIIHLLAGDLFANIPVGHENDGAGIFTSMQMDSAHHSINTNLDGMLYSGEPFFFTPNNRPYKFVDPLVDGTGDVTGITSAYINPRYPVKMLFGTGSEYAQGDWAELVGDYGGSSNSVKDILGYEASSDFDNHIDDSTNYYSNTFNTTSNEIIQTRTVQPINTEPLTEPTLVKNEIFGVTGAIKNCLIKSSAEASSKHTPPAEMANLEFRGVGRPSFIYASRSLSSVKEHSLSEHQGYVKIGKSSDSVKFDNKLVFSVLMPRTSGFYPYNGWILKEAGLFSDSLFYTNPANSDTATYRGKMPCGNLLAKRYISPILKTSDNSVEFIWSIYISPN